MDTKIPFFDKQNVGFATRRLSDCFNLAAENQRDPQRIAALGVELYAATTQAPLPENFNADESAFLRFSFLGVAAKIRGERNSGWVPHAEALFETVEKIEKALQKEMSYPRPR
jgi:hypothetical protein